MFFGKFVSPHVSLVVNQELSYNFFGSVVTFFYSGVSISVSRVSSMLVVMVVVSEVRWTRNF